MTDPRPLPPKRPPRLDLACALAAALALPGLARADASPADASSPVAPAPTGWTAYGPIRPVAGLLLTGSLSNEDATVANPDGSTVRGNLGARVQAFAGAEFALAANGLRLRLTAGIHEGRMSGAGGHETVTRYPLEATLLYPVGDSLRVGGGVRYPARLRFGGAGARTSDGLSAQPGAVAVADWRLSPHLLLDLRYVVEHYQAAAGGSSVDASHWGIGATAMY